MDDHRVARDTARGVVRADGERDGPDLQARVHVVRRGVAKLVAVPDRVVIASPRVRGDRARGFARPIVAALGLLAVAGSAINSKMVVKFREMADTGRRASAMTLRAYLRNGSRREGL